MVKYGTYGHHKTIVKTVIDAEVEVQILSDNIHVILKKSITKLYMTHIKTITKILNIYMYTYCISVSCKTC